MMTQEVAESSGPLAQLRLTVFGNVCVGNHTTD